MNSDFEFDRYIKIDKEVLRKMQQVEGYAIKLEQAYNFINDFGINSKIVYYKYKNTSTQLESFNCEYEEILSFIRLQNTNYRDIVENYLKQDKPKKHIYKIC